MLLYSINFQVYTVTLIILYILLFSIQDETCKKLSDKTGQNKTQIKRYIWNKNRDEVNQRKVIKFGEAMWRAMFYLS